MAADYRADLHQRTRKESDRPKSRQTKLNPGSSKIFTNFLSIDNSFTVVD